MHPPTAQSSDENASGRFDTGVRALRLDTATAAANDVLAFGPFRLDRVQHVLRKSGKPVRMGGRALEILLVLLDRPGETVSKRDLLKRVWAHGVIEDGTMRAHITALRRVLRESDSSGGSRAEYIQNVPGRGYRFAAHVVHVREVSPAAVTPASSSALQPAGSLVRRTWNSPLSPLRMLGRAKAVKTLAARVSQQRFVTIAGPGGIGKTTLALHLAHMLAPRFAHGTCFIDLALLSEPEEVLGAIASALGLIGLTADPLAEILNFCRDKRLLIVLDNCEHLIEVAATLVELILRSAPGVQCLATSREPLSAEGESVHRLEPLATPPERRVAGVDALHFPAVQLFIERAGASDDSFELHEADVPLIVQICQRLDGNPLAIQLAAERVNLLGVRGLAASLDQGLHLTIEGHRTAVRRHQTLRAMLDWSYALLSPSEQVVLRRVAVFVESFDHSSAIAVVADETLDAAEVFRCLAGLAAKSLLAVDVTAEKVLYRLPNTARAYAFEKLCQSCELAMTLRRHAQMWRTSGAELRAWRGANGGAIVGRRLEELREVLLWCFSSASGTSVGTRFALTSLWLELAFARRRPHLEGPIQNPTLLKQLLHARDLERRTTPWGPWIERLILGDYRVATRISESFHARGSLTEDDESRALDQILTVAHHYAGQQSLARHHAERVLGASRDCANELLQRCHARGMLARILWVQGFADQAIRLVRENVSIAFVFSAAKPYLYCGTLLNAVEVETWCGNLTEAQSLLTEARCFLSEQRERALGRSFELHQLWASCLETVLAVRRGELHVEAELQLSDDPWSSSQYLDELGTFSEDLVSACAIVRVERGRGGWYAAEILRVKGERMLKAAGSSAAIQAEAQFQAALETARRQDSLALELRAALSLARLLRDQHRVESARDLLMSVYRRFTEGFGTADLIAAQVLLQGLTRSCPGVAA